MLKRIIGAVAFLSRIPLETDEKPKDCVQHFPFLGYLSGGLLTLLIWLLGSSLPAAALDMFVVYLLFNAFYFDGLLDTSDAFMSQRSKEEKLKIMKLGNIGPMALLTGTIYLIIKLHILTNIPLWAIIISSVSSKYTVVVAAATSHPAKNEGLGSQIMPVKISSLLWAAIYLIPFLFFPKALVLLLAAIVTGLSFTWISHKMINGTTGDVFGAIEEISELAAMAAAVFL